MRTNLRLCVFFGVAIFLGAVEPARAISEKGYEAAYLNTVVPFLNHGDAFLFSTRDGVSLSGVRFVHPESRGTIVVVEGRSEPWLKYGEVFYDLYQRGFTLYAYDHRGQGRSPHLVSTNRQIGHIDDFAHYAEDLEDFVRTVVVPSGEKNLFLLAHSMGGAVAAQYLERGTSPFRSAVLLSPMLAINTKPYATPIAKAITWFEIGAGRDEAYAPGKKDFDPSLPFEKNDVTGSPERFWMSNAVFRMYPETTVGGPSNGWVFRSLMATPKILRRMKLIATPTLMFQAGRDQVVKTKEETIGCAAAVRCRLVTFPESEHEILMERDAIRDPALEAIDRFFR